MRHDLSALTTSQLEWLDSVIGQFKLPHSFDRDPESDLMVPEALERFGDALRIHHAFSRQPLSKDRFEYALERALFLSGIPAQLEESRTNRGHDLTIAGVPTSLKTEAAANIKEDVIHISKWMELGKGPWELDRLRDMFLDHMRNYDRIFTLRCITRTPKKAPIFFKYELVEIPKSLMLKSANARLVVQNESRQSPRPGYGYIEDSKGKPEFALYFDGGTERKLQIRHLRKALCRVHATWEFDSTLL